MLKVEHISKHYDDIKAVDDLSFEVKPGEIFGLLGVNGAGKTTTFRMIVNLIDSETGHITLDDKPIDYTVTDKIGFLTEERSLFTKMFVDEQIMLYGRLKGMSKEEISKKTDYWLKRLNMEEFKHKKIKELSKGNQQKLQFITSVINEPKLLILDEPFTSLDPFNVSLLVEVLREMRDKGSIVIFSSHRMEHVELFCERLLILVRGKSILSGSLKQIKEDFRKKSIHVIGKIDVKKIKELKGVEDVEKTPEEYIIRITDKKYIDDVFKIVKTGENIIRFNVEDPTLDEIFVSKVGEVYDE